MGGGRAAAIKITGSGVKLAFRFDVPDHLLEADVEQIDAYHFWRLTVKANIKSVDLNRQYNIPVFATGASSRYVRHDVSVQVSARVGCGKTGNRPGRLRYTRFIAGNAREWA
jgi:hypothetical protein